MSTLYSDTHPKIERMQIEFIRRMLADLMLGEELAGKVYGEMNRAK